MTTTLVALALAVIAVVALISGAAVLWGLGVALLVGGVLSLAGAVLAYDPDIRRRK